MTKPQARSFEIRRVQSSDIDGVVGFHKASVGVHLMPRSEAYFRKLVDDTRIYAAHEVTAGTDELVAICYITDAVELESYRKPGQERLEFGGVFARPEVRGLGLTSALGRCAIISQVGFDPPIGRVIAHVHELNNLPRGMLEKQLGFIRSAEEDEVVPDDDVPPSMEKNKNGLVIGHLYVLPPKALSDYAGWLEAFSGKVEGSDGTTSNLNIRLELFTLREQVLTALRDLAASWSGQ